MSGQKKSLSGESGIAYIGGILRLIAPPVAISGSYRGCWDDTSFPLGWREARQLEILSGAMVIWGNVWSLTE